MKKLLLLFSLITLQLKGQNKVVREEIIQQQMEIKYALDATLNGIITALAEGNGKTKTETKYIISVKQKIITGLREPLQHSYIVSEPLSLTGDIFYKGFTMQDQITPSLLNFNLKIWHHTNELQNTPINNVKVLDKVPERYEFSFYDSLGKVTHHTTENFAPIYSSSKIEDFKKRVKLINSYWSDTKKVEEINLLLRAINLNDVDRITLEQKKLNDANYLITEIESKYYNTSLLLLQNDPANLLQKLNLFHEQAVTVQNNLNQVLSTLHIAYYDRALNFLRLNDVVAATNYFNQSLNANPSFAPSLLQLALLDFRNNSINDALTKTDALLYRMNADLETKSRTYQLLNEIYESRLDKASIQLNNEEYHRALELYNMAKNICDTYSNVKCSDDLFTGLRATKIGIYTEYINAAKNFLENKRFEKAEQVLKEAIAYQQINSVEIPSAEALQPLQKEVNTQRYIAKIEEGKQALNQNEFELAVSVFDEASQMEMNLVLTTNGELKQLKQNAAQFYCTELLKDGDSLVQINKLDEARLIVRKTAEIQTNNLLTSDKIINGKLEALRAKIITQQCKDAQLALDTWHGKAKENITKSDFIMADSYFKNAVKIIDDNKDCDLINSKIEAEHTAILPAATYLKLMLEVNNSQAEGNYNDAQKKYAEGENYYSENNVSSFNIQHISFDDYLQHKAVNGFVYFMADQYTANDELRKALVLFKLLQSRSYDNRQLSGSLFLTGKKFGIKEKSNRPGNRNWKEYARLITNADRKMSAFEKGFKKGWKSVK